MVEGKSYTLSIRKEQSRLEVTMKNGETVSVKIPDSLLDYPFGEKCNFIFLNGKLNIDKRSIFRELYSNGSTYIFDTKEADSKHVKVIGSYGFIQSIPKQNNGIEIGNGKYRFTTYYQDAGTGIRLVCAGAVETETVQETDMTFRKPESCTAYTRLLYDLNGMSSEELEEIALSSAKEWLEASQSTDSKKKFINDPELIIRCSRMLRALAELSPISAIGLLNKSKDLIRNMVMEKAPFGSDEISRFNPKVFGELLVKADFVIRPEGQTIVGDNATVILENDIFSLYPCCIDDYDRSYPFFERMTSIFGKEAVVFSHISDKLKLEDENDTAEYIEKISILYDKITRNRHSSGPRLNEYSIGDEFYTKVTNIYRGPDGKGFMTLESIDPTYENISGDVMLNDIYFFNDNSIEKVIREGDIFRVRLNTSYLVSPDDEEYREEEVYSNLYLSVIEAFNRYFETRPQSGDRINAMLYYTSKDKSFWMSEYGYIIYTEPYKNLDSRTYAYLTVSKVSPKGFVTAEFDRNDINYSRFNPYAALKSRLRSHLDKCAKEAEDYLNSISPHIPADKYFPEITMTLLKLTQFQETNIGRLELFSCIMLLSAISGQDKVARYAKQKMLYIDNLMDFAGNRTEKIRVKCADKDIADLPDIAEEKIIEQLLYAYGRPEMNGEIYRMSQQWSGDRQHKLFADLSSLVISYNLSKDIMNKSIMDSFRKRILTLLSLSDCSENEMLCYSESDKDFVGFESSVLEFKTSAVYEAGKTDSADFNVQANVILKTIYAFMNTDGGTLYIGVNDTGYIVGIKPDLDYLMLPGIDSYCRFLLDQFSLMIGRNTVNNYIQINPAYEGRAVRIDVRPSGRLMDLDGKYFKRVGPESRQMSDNSVLIEMDRIRSRYGTTGTESAQ